MTYRIRSSEAQHAFTNRCLALNPSFDAECIGQKAVIVYNDERYVVLEGADVALILSLFRDGPRSKEDLIGQLKGASPPERIGDILTQLEDRGWIVEHDPEATREEAAFWALMNLDSLQINRRLRQVRVDVRSFGRLDDTALRSALNSLDIRIKDDGDE